MKKQMVVGTAAPHRDELAHDPFGPSARQQELVEPPVRGAERGDLPVTTGLRPFPLRNSLPDMRHALGPAAVRLRTPTAPTLLLDLAGATVDLLAFDAAIADASRQ